MQIKCSKSLKYNYIAITTKMYLIAIKYNYNIIGPNSDAYL